MTAVRGIILPGRQQGRNVISGTVTSYPPS